MIELGPATEDEMIVAFLKAEIDSSRYDEHFANPLVEMGFTRRLIDEPNVLDPIENQARKQLLDYRSYARRTALFREFPMDATWRGVRLEENGSRALRYANHPTWNDLSPGTRLVATGAHNFRNRPDDPDTDQINGITEAVRNGVRFPELIVAQGNQDCLILIEGHSRATGYLLEQFVGEVPALVASSQSMQNWTFY